jgi:hypothetical protein
MFGALTVALLFIGLQLSQAVKIHLYPSQTFFRSTLSSNEASFALSRHLGLEFFEFREDTSSANYDEELFVGKGSSNALLLTTDEVDAKGSSQNSYSSMCCLIHFS